MVKAIQRGLFHGRTEIDRALKPENEETHLPTIGVFPCNTMWAKLLDTIPNNSNTTWAPMPALFSRCIKRCCLKANHHSWIPANPLAWSNPPSMGSSLDEKSTFADLLAKLRHPSCDRSVLLKSSLADLLAGLCHPRFGWTTRQKSKSADLLAKPRQSSFGWTSHQKSRSAALLAELRHPSSGWRCGQRRDKQPGCSAPAPCPRSPASPWPGSPGCSIN